MAVVHFSSQLLFGMPNAGELVITLLIIVVLFGGKKIPELARGLGKGIREFQTKRSRRKCAIAAARRDIDGVVE